jgi:hypothetical protein
MAWLLPTPPLALAGEIEYSNGISLERTAGRSPASQELCSILGNACVA